jgi:hypothetical protein
LLLQSALLQIDADRCRSLQIIADLCFFSVRTEQIVVVEERVLVYHSGGHCDYITGEYPSGEVVFLWYLVFFSPVGCPFAVQFVALVVAIAVERVVTLCELPRRGFGKERSVLGEWNVLTLLPNPTIFTFSGPA